MPRRQFIATRFASDLASTLSQCAVPCARLVIGVISILLCLLTPAAACTGFSGTATNGPSFDALPSIKTWTAPATARSRIGNVDRFSMSHPALPCGSVLGQMQHAMRTTLARGGVVLLGEIHDNAAHHAVRGDMLRVLLAANVDAPQSRAPALVFEHITPTQAAGITTLSAAITPGARTQTTADLFTALAWDRSGWPAAHLFAPMFDAALASGAAILPGNADSADVRDIARGKVLSPSEAARLGLDQALAPPLADALLDELEASHCGLVPKAHFTTMATAQRYRDAVMAARVLAAARAHGGAILFTGNGHVRTDRGVPAALKRLAPDLPVVAIMLIEADTAGRTPEQRVPRAPDGAPAADFALYTPTATRTDPCIEMRARFKKAG